MGKFIDRVGETHKNNKGESFTIIGYRDNKNVDIQFEDGTTVINRSYNDILKGKVKNLNTISVYGVGYIGEGSYKTSISGKHTKDYASWKRMLGRCYSKLELKKNPTYIEVTVCEQWHNFQNFAKWHEENWKDHMDSSWDLDKDILFKGNKIYGPETCCFVPQEINLILTKSDIKRGELPIGVSKYLGKYSVRCNSKGHIGIYDTIEESFQAYKNIKEETIKEVADKYKVQITPDVYKALYNYSVEIND